MPVKNQEKYIAEALDSVLAQTYSNIEVVIVNDGSSDKTVEILKKFKDNRIILLHTMGIGKNRAFNLAFGNSTGEFICYFAGDDLLEPDSVQNRISPLKGKPDEKIASVSKLCTFSSIKKFNGIITPRAKDKGTMIGGTIFMTRKMAEIVFPLPGNIHNEDKWTVLNLNYFADHIYHVPVVTIKYRIHLQNSSSRTDPFRKKNISMHKRFIVYREFLEKHEGQIQDHASKELKLMAKAEELRFRRKPFKILMLRGLTSGEKVRFIFHSNALLYWIRIQLFGLLSGR